jgi:hypothetical protein
MCSLSLSLVRECECECGSVGEVCESACELTAKWVQKSVCVLVIWVGDRRGGARQSTREN